jgi:hypothetical protein
MFFAETVSLKELNNATHKSAQNHQEPEVFSIPSTAVIFNVIGRRPETLVELAEALVATELLDADPFEELPSDSSAQASMSPNAEVLDAKLEPLLVFATPSEHAEPKFFYFVPTPHLPSQF